MAPHASNVGTTERVLSILGGLGLTLMGARRGGPLRRVAASAVGLSLLTRGVTGYCAMKAAALGQTSLKQGFAEQWRRVASGLDSRKGGEEGEPSESMQPGSSGQAEQGSATGSAADSARPH